MLRLGSVNASARQRLSRCEILASLARTPIQLTTWALTHPNCAGDCSRVLGARRKGEKIIVLLITNYVRKHNGGIR